MVAEFIKIKDLQPSQLYISKEKLDAIMSWLDPNDFTNFEPVPIKLLDGEIVITDGHTRLVAALLLGLETVPLMWDEDELNWDMYRACVKECKKQGLLSPIDLLKRIVSKDDTILSGINGARICKQRCLENKSPKRESDRP